MNKEEFESLSPEEQARVFYQSSFREKTELLAYSHKPDYLTQSLSPEELYLMTRELDLEERSDIVQYASMPQLLFISDVDCWKKDRVDGLGFVHWLEVLLKADEERLVAWIEEMDYETVVAGLKKNIRVLKPEWEYAADEALGDEPYFTLDERYFILVKEENLETVKRVIERLFETHRGRYVALLEGVLNDMEDELEEEGFRRREMRLAEHGFPSPEEARRIYIPVSKEEFDKFPLKNAPEEDAGSPPAAPKHSAYPALRSKERLFLDEVLFLFTKEAVQTGEGLQEELMWLSNKIIACDGIDFASEERVRNGVERARHIVNVGLQDLSGESLEAARRIIRERWLELIFRWGVGRLVELRQAVYTVMKVYWQGNREAFLRFLNPPYEAVFRGLSQNPPLYGGNKTEASPPRDFRSTEDVQAMKLSVLQLDKAHAFLLDNFPNLFHRLNVEAERGTMNATLFSLLGTVYVWYALDGKISDYPLPVAKVRAFLDKGFRTGPQGKEVDPSTREKFLKQFFPAEIRKIVDPLWHRVFSELESEMSRLDPRAEIDPRYISMLCFAS